MLAYMTIGDDHMLATESKQITTTETDKDGKPVVKYEEPLQYVQLHPATEEFAKKDTMKIASSIIIRQTI